MKQDRGSKLSIVIPCLNEIQTIDKLIKMIVGCINKYKRKDFEIIVVDNGSTDGTLEKLRKVKDIQLIKEPIKGYGSTLHTGILSARSPYVFFADADLSYDFYELDNFIPFMKINYDLVVGSRFKGVITKDAMPFFNQYIGTPILSYLIRMKYHINTTDCNSGMRLVKKSFYKKLKMRCFGMEWASELLIRTAIHRGKFIEIPIKFFKDQRKYKSHLNRWVDGLKHLKIILSFNQQL